MSDDLSILTYVKAAAALLCLPLDEAQAQRVAAHLTRTAALAGPLEQAAMAPADEPAQVYCPAPFPPATGGEYLP